MDREMCASDPERPTAFTRGGSSSTVQVALTAVFAALTTVATVIVAVPFPTSTGYLNFGDALVMLSGFLLGPIGGFIAGGFGSAMGDVALGYTQFAPITFVVKGCEGGVVGLFCRMASGTSRLARGVRTSSDVRVTDVLGLLLAAMTMMLGYFLFEIPIYGFGVALAEMTTVNWIQVSVGAIVTLIVGPSLRHFLNAQIPSEAPEETLVVQPTYEEPGS